MPELTKEQRQQLDSGIKSMLDNGASEEDVNAYANDFHSKFSIEPLKKKDSTVALPSTSNLDGSTSESTISPLVQKPLPTPASTNELGNQQLTPGGINIPLTNELPKPEITAETIRPEYLKLREQTKATSDIIKANTENLNKLKVQANAFQEAGDTNGANLAIAEYNKKSQENDAILKSNQADYTKQRQLFEHIKNDDKDLSTLDTQNNAVDFAKDLWNNAVPNTVKNVAKAYEALTQLSPDNSEDISLAGDAINLDTGIGEKIGALGEQLADPNSALNKTLEAANIPTLAAHVDPSYENADIFKKNDKGEYVNKTNPVAIAKLMSSAIGQAAGMVASGIASGGTGVAINAFATTTGQIYDQAQKEGGLSKKEAAAFAFKVAPIISAIDVVTDVPIMDAIGKKFFYKEMGKKVTEKLLGKEMTAEALQRAATTSLGEIMVESAKSTGKATLKEGVTGGVQDGIQKLAEIGYDAGLDKDIEIGKGKFGTTGKDVMTGIIEGAISEAAGGAPMGMIGASTSPKQRKLLYNAVIEAKNDPEKLQNIKDKIQELQDNGSINEEEAKRYNANLDNIMATDAKIPNHVTGEKAREQAHGLVAEKEVLQQQMEGLDDAMAKPLKQKLEVIDEALTSISENNKPVRLKGEDNIHPLTADEHDEFELLQLQHENELDMTEEEKSKFEDLSFRNQAEKQVDNIGAKQVIEQKIADLKTQDETGEFKPLQSGIPDIVSEPIELSPTITDPKILAEMEAEKAKKAEAETTPPATEQVVADNSVEQTPPIVSKTESSPTKLVELEKPKATKVNPPAPKVKEDIIDQEEEAKKAEQESISEDADFIKRMDTDMEALKQTSNDKVPIKYKAVENRVRQAIKDKKIKEETGNDFIDRMDDVVGQKGIKISTQAKKDMASEIKQDDTPEIYAENKRASATKVKASVDKGAAVVAEKLVGKAKNTTEARLRKEYGDEWEKHIPQKQGVDIEKVINITAAMIKKSIDAGVETQIAIHDALQKIKATSAYKKLIEGGDITEDDFDKNFNAEVDGDIIDDEVKVEQEKLSGIKKALAPEEKIQANDLERRSEAQLQELGKALYESGEIDTEALVADLMENPRALQAEEVVALTYHKRLLDNKYNSIIDKIAKAKEEDNVEQEVFLRTQLKAQEAKIDNFHTIALSTGSEQSLSFRLRKMLLDSEYNLQSQITRYKSINNGTIPDDVRIKFEEYDKKIKELNKQIDELKEKQELNEGEQAIADIKESVDREQAEKKNKKTISEAKAKRKKELSNKFRNRLNDVTAVMTLIADKEFYEYAGLVFEEAGGDFNKFAKEIIDNVGKGIKAHLPDLYKKLGGKGDTTFESDKPYVKDNKLKIPSSLIRDLVAAGYEDIDSIVDEIHSRIKETLPNVTKRDVRDSITNYGKTINLSKEEIDVKVRELKRTGRLISALEDVQNKKRPLRSGLQRDKLTQQERSLQKQIKEGLKDIPISEEENNKNWATALDVVKSRLKNQIEDLEKQIATGEKTSKKKGIEYDQEAKNLVDQRDALKKIIESTEGKPKMSDEQRVRMVEKALEKSIAETQRRIDEGDFMSKIKPTPAQSQKITELKKQKEELQKVYKKIQDDLGITEGKRLETYKKNLGKSISNLQERIDNKDYAKKEKAKKVSLDQEAKDLERQKNEVREKFDTEVEKARLKNRTKIEKVKDALIDILNLPKALEATADLSGVIRQGGLLSVANPKEVGKAMKEMGKQTFSEEKAKEFIEKVRESDVYPLMKKAKLYISEPSAKMSAKEEAFISNIAKKIPGIGHVVSGSERAYSGYLNTLRVDVFTKMVDQMTAAGYDPDVDIKPFKDLAWFVNNATGRGDLGAFEESAKILNGLFFSPRFIASRFNLLNPLPIGKTNYWTLDPMVRKEALKSMSAYIGTGVAILAMLAASGMADVEDDPRSADFGKIKIGTLRYDIWGGFQQSVRFLTQFGLGQKKSTTTGKIHELNGKGRNSTRMETLGTFLRGKLSPTAGIAASALIGKTMGYEEFKIQNEAWKLMAPIYVADMIDMYKKDKLEKAPAVIIPSIFGIGVQDYDKKSNKEKK